MTGSFRSSACSAQLQGAVLSLDASISGIEADLFLDRLLRAHGPAFTGAMKASARARCDQLCAADLDDIVSESLLKLLELLRSGRGVFNALAMARRIAANMATDRRRWMARAGRFRQDWKVHLETSGTHLLEETEHDLFSLMVDVLEELREEERALLVDTDGGLDAKTRKRRSRSLAKARGIARQKFEDEPCH